MYRQRLRPAPTADELADLYPVPHDAERFGHDHWLRCETTITLGQDIGMRHRIDRVVDLSAGNGRVAREIAAHVGAYTVLGDLAVGHEIVGPIETTIRSASLADVVPSLFVCGETVEHLDDPDDVLRAAAERFDWMVLSTPIAETGTGNPEHVWGWDQDAVAVMFDQAGWISETRVDLLLPSYYSFQLWTARSAPRKVEG